VKSPFEYTISAVRAVNGKITDAAPIARALQQIGEPLYGAQPPTGYSDKADVWINTRRTDEPANFALSLAGNKLPGVQGDIRRAHSVRGGADASRSVEALALALTGGNLTEESAASSVTDYGSRKAPVQDPWDKTQLRRSRA